MNIHLLVSRTTLLLSHLMSNIISNNYNTRNLIQKPVKTKPTNLNYYYKSLAKRQGYNNNRRQLNIQLDPKFVMFSLKLFAYNFNKPILTSQNTNNALVLTKGIYQILGQNKLLVDKISAYSSDHFELLMDFLNYQNEYSEFVSNLDYRHLTLETFLAKAISFLRNNLDIVELGGKVTHGINNEQFNGILLPSILNKLKLVLDGVNNNVHVTNEAIVVLKQFFFKYHRNSLQDLKIVFNAFSKQLNKNEYMQIVNFVNYLMQKYGAKY